MSAGDWAGSELRPEDVHIDETLVRGLIAEQFPQWADLHVKPVDSQGMDNATFRLGDEMSVRLPRYPRWEGQVAREQRWLPFLAERVPMQISVPLALGRPGPGYPFSWSVYRWLEGENADPEGLTDLRETATDLAEFIGALWRIDSAGGPPPEWSNGFRGADLADERDSPVVASRMRARIEALDGLVDTDAVTAVWQTALDAPRWDGPPVWIHGDPAPGNLLAVNGRLSAVIDFGTMAVGDPACDMIAAWQFLDADTRAVFRSVLPVDDATWARGRAWGLTGALPSRSDLTGDPARAAAARRRLDALVTDHREDAVARRG
ncbi:aminoglycoside phosphotransferase family protein [Streptomyces canus]|uniref:aminoglycoside phosphotransferase family protein n=1 Tax=Streptomyces canus TaxID=58343 RepID=UPI002E286186|nr:aminoglycoside phosphotransferase family protein [Streptomyces canus]